MICKIMLRNCGLIVGCFKGYIELICPIEFKTVMKWEGQIEPVKINKPKRKKTQEYDFSKELTMLN
jgi:hypothetical protein